MRKVASRRCPHNQGLSFFDHPFGRKIVVAECASCDVIFKQKGHRSRICGVSRCPRATPLTSFERKWITRRRLSFSSDDLLYMANERRRIAREYRRALKARRSAKRFK